MIWHMTVKRFCVTDWKVVFHINVIAFVTFVNDGEIQEIFLCCKELPQTSKGIDIFNILSSYLVTRGLSRRECVGISTDGAPSMVGFLQGFTSHIKQENPDIILTQCFFTERCCFQKHLENELKTVFVDVSKMVNFIKQRPVHSRMFKRLCENLDKEHLNLLLHAEIRWLSRRRVLNKLFELKDELHKYFQETNKQGFAKCFEDEHWRQRPSYFADIFHQMNQLNKSLLGPKENILTSSYKILAFKRKVNLWKRYVAKGILEMFQLHLGLKSEERYQRASTLI